MSEIPTTSATTHERQLRADRTSDLTRRMSIAANARELRRLQDDLATCNLPVAVALASRYRDRGVPLDDLEQVAAFALVAAARRFDPDAGHNFLSFCVPTIRGELRRYFRDLAWHVRPTRRVQEVQQAIARIGAGLPQQSAALTTREVADRLGLPEGDIIEAMAVQGAFTPTSLDGAVSEQSPTTLGDLLGGADPELRRTEARIVLERVLGLLVERDRLIITRRFLEGWTQQEIGADIGVSQTQVSRLLTRIFADLRALIGESDLETMVA